MNKIGNVTKKILVCLLIIGVTLIVDYLVQDYVYKSKCELLEDDFSHVFQIDSIKVEDNKFVLTGWVFKLDEDSKTDDFDIILSDYNNGKHYYMNVMDVVREDVNECFLCEYDYSNAGFVADIGMGKLDLYNTNYEVIIRPKDKLLQKAYKSGIYISNGKVMFVKPEDYVPLDVDGTKLEKIIKEGVLRVYRPDVGMYVYQYEESVYWIADESYFFENDGSTYIEYSLNTTQNERLPEYRQQYNFDDKRFYFESNELGVVESIYRVAVSKIPKEYSVWRVGTGYYNYANESWIWLSHFRIFYEFE